MIWMLARASTKLIATFIVVFIFFILSFVFAPGLVRAIQDFADMINNLTRTPPLGEQALILYRTFVNENTIMGITLTVIARVIVEIAAWIGGTYIFKSED
ncbi:MAG: hypothetical protein AAFQ67_07855 [Pseudomonadota bacterium]